MLKIKLHRGSHQIGGSITEIYTENTHIFIDFGSELNPAPGESTDGKMIEMMQKAKCDAVLFTHYHGDHVGLIDHVPEKDVDGKPVMLGMGVTARKILNNIHDTLLSFDDLSEEDRSYHENCRRILNDRSRQIDIEDGKDFEIGDFLITPIMVDHSAYDAYLFIIESKNDHRIIVHTGDFRTHGRLGKDLFDRVRDGMRGREADILIIEGTMLSRMNEKVLTEKELQKEACEELRKPENKYAFLICSSTNMESLASFANAAWAVNGRGKKGRKLFVNPYVYEQLKVYRKDAGKDKYGFGFFNANVLEGMDFYNPKLGMTQLEYMEKHGFVMLIGTSVGYKKRIDYFKNKGYDPLLIYSMWDGYINKEEHPDCYNEKLGALYHGWKKDRIFEKHTSGHATCEDIAKMILTIAPKEGILPIHTEKPDAFYELDIGEFSEKLKKVDDNGILELL